MINDYYLFYNLSPEEMKQRKFDIMFRDRSYETPSLSFDLGIGYRADTREEFLQDATGVLVESALAYVTGGSSLLVRTAIKRITELVDDDFGLIPVA